MAIFRFVRLFSLALWVGGGALVAFVVAPAVFRVAPSRRLAGDINGAIFRGLDRVVLGCLVALAAAEGVEATTGWSARDVARLGLESLMAVAAALSIFVVSPRIRALRPRIDSDKAPADDPSPEAGSSGSVSQPAHERARFGRFHGASVMLLLAQLLFGAFAIALSVPLR